MTTTAITPAQEQELERLFKEVITGQNISEQDACLIITKGEELQRGIQALLEELSNPDNRFGKATSEFMLKVPMDYDRTTHIDTSLAKARAEKSTLYVNSYFTSANLPILDTALIPGKTYQVKIFPIKTRVTAADCLAFLEIQEAILVGGTGIALVYDHAKNEIPKGGWIASFDHPQHGVYKDSDGDYRVPCIKVNTRGEFRFNLNLFRREWGPGDHLLCFCAAPQGD